MRPTHYISRYVPMRCKRAYAQEIRFRNFVLQFKNGNTESANIAARLISRKILENFDNVRAHLICAPAANESAYRNRYKRFSEIVCRECGMVNDFDKVRYYGTRLAIHELKDRGQERNITALTCCDIEITAGERYVIFDDIITKGKTFTTIADYIESKSGEVIAGYFLGKTIWR